MTLPIIPPMESGNLTGEISLPLLTEVMSSRRALFRVLAFMMMMQPTSRQKLLLLIVMVRLNIPNLRALPVKAVKSSRMVNMSMLQILFCRVKSVAILPTLKMARKSAFIAITCCWAMLTKARSNRMVHSVSNCPMAA